MNGSKRNILITGGLGNLGAWVTEYFSADHKNDVYVLTKNDKNSNKPESVKKIFCDITDQLQLPKALAEIEFEYVIHLASLNETFEDNYSKKSLLINSYGTQNLLSAISNRGIKNFLYVSTFHVYGKSGGSVYEEDTAAPLNDYAITHYFAEQYIEMFSRRNDLPYTILRLSNSYGCPKDIHTSKWYLLFNDLCRQAAISGKVEMKTNGRGLRDFIYMGDVCIAMEKILFKENLKKEIFNLGSGKSLSLLDVAFEIKRAYDEDFNEELQIIVNKNDNIIYPDFLEFNIGKLAKAINFKPGDFYNEEAKKIFKLIGKGE